MRRNLLTDNERHRLFDIPPDRLSLIPRYTLLSVEIELLGGKRGANNCLRPALQLCLLRHPHFGLAGDQVVPPELLRHLAEQLGVPAAVATKTMPPPSQP